MGNLGNIIFKALELREQNIAKEQAGAQRQALIDLVSSKLPTEKRKEFVNQPQMDMAGMLQSIPTETEVDRPIYSREQLGALMGDETAKKALLGMVMPQIETPLQKAVAGVPSDKIIKQGGFVSKPTTGITNELANMFAPPELSNQVDIEQITPSLMTPQEFRPAISAPRGMADYLNDVAREYAGKGGLPGALGAANIYKDIMQKAEKEFNIPGDLDSFLAGISGRYSVNYATPEGRMEMLQKYGNDPSLMKEFKEFKTSPYFAVVPTAEGLTLIDTRKGQKAGTIGGKPLTGEMITTEQQIGSLNTVLDDVRNLYKPDYVGPLTGRYGGLKEVTMGLPEEQALFNSKLASIQNSLIYLKSGKQINEAEYKRLLRQLPDKNLPSSTFEARMKGFEQEVESIIKERQKVSGGYGVSNRQTQTKETQQKENKTDPLGLRKR